MIMMKLTIPAAALIAAAAFVAVPANADFLGGGPIKSKDGKCWKAMGAPRDGTFGTWIECPKAAAGGASDCSLGQLAWEKKYIGQQFFDHCARGGAAAAANASAKPVATNQRAAR